MKEEGEEEWREGWRKERKEGRKLCLWTPPTPHREGLKLNIQKSKIMASGPIISWQTDGETMETVTDVIWGTPKSLQMVTVAMKSKDACPLEEKL